MTELIIFGAEKLIFLSPLLLFIYFLRAAREKRLRILAVGILSLPLTYLSGLLARSLYENPRPFVVEGIEPLIAHSADNGFPSDHLLLLGAIAALISLFDRKYALVLWLMAFLVGAARVMAGVHHVEDILGSIVIALIATLLVYAALGLRKKV